jgi:anti-sigma B factor antagonist
MGDVTAVAAVGDIDIDWSEELRECLNSIVDRDERQIVLDLSQVRFVDSTFLGVLVGIRNRLLPVGGQVAVVCPHSQVVKTFQLTGLDQVFPLYSTLDDVVRA